MEATSLDNAVEAMLAPEPSEENQSEAVEAAEAPTQDVESEAVEDVAGGDDDVEASGEDIEDAEYVEDDQIDDDDLVEAAEDTNLIPVKINGKEERWTLDQLKQSAAGQGYINQKMQENAALEKHYKEQAQALAQQQQQVLAMYQQAQQGGLQAPTPPSKELFDQDPIGYMEAKLTYDEAKAAHDQQLYQLQGMHQQQAQQQQAARQAYLAEQAEVLKQYIPEIADPKKGEMLKTEIMDTGIHYGFTPEEMAGVSDARYVRALNDARKYRQLVANKQKSQSKADGVRPVVKAGAKKRPDGQAATRKKAQQRLQKTGSIDDALSLMLKS
ncbi:hypothetical protein OAA13_00325 [Crocinitomicaceae bacterium]|nr:hypothetical protein [Crocinitomicaceae bacterium]